MASKKGVSSSRNGRDSAGKRLGAKLADGQVAKAGQIIYRQRGTKIHAGENVKRAKDDTLFTLTNGVVHYEKFGGGKTRVKVVSSSENKN